MGILDEAIKEHLELKRQHGAGDSELKKIEDEAFGPPERPGSEPAASLAEAPTEFMAEPAGAEEAPPQRRAPDIADLQEAPEPESEPVAREDEPTEEEPPAEEEQPAMEHEAIANPDEAIAEPQPPAAPTADERLAISEEPTQLYDVEEGFADSEPRAPSEEELVEEEIGEPRLAPVDPLAGAEEGDEEEDDDFFDEQRLSDELDQALEAPAELEPEEEDLEPEGEPAPQGPDEDLLEETPDFLEEAPEDDQLWFEQKPPKDFDFDD